MICHVSEKKLVDSNKLNWCIIVWWDSDKGFGFAETVLAGKTERVFVHNHNQREINLREGIVYFDPLNRSSLEKLERGVEICCTLDHSKDGFKALNWVFADSLKIAEQKVYDAELNLHMDQEMKRTEGAIIRVKLKALAQGEVSVSLPQPIFSRHKSFPKYHGPREQGQKKARELELLRFQTSFGVRSVRIWLTIQNRRNQKNEKKPRLSSLVKIDSSRNESTLLQFDFCQNVLIADVIFTHKNQLHLQKPLMDIFPAAVFILFKVMIFAKIQL